MIHIPDIEGKIRRAVEGHSRIGEPSGDVQLRKIIKQIYEMGKDDAEDGEYDNGYDAGFEDGYAKGKREVVKKE